MRPVRLDQMPHGKLTPNIEALPFYRVLFSHHKHLKSIYKRRTLNEEIKQRIQLVRIFLDEES